MKDLKVRFTLVPAVYVVFRRGKEVLLLRRFQTGYHDGEFSLPAGHIEGGEPAVLAAVREAREEVGVEVSPQDLRLVHALHRYSAEPKPHERMDLFFEATRWQGELTNAEPHKCSELRWVDISALPEDMVPEVAFALEAIAAGRSYGDYNFESRVS